MAHTFSKLLYHIIYSTKDRRPFLDRPFADKLFAYQAGIVSKLGGRALIINGPTDHAHALVSLPTTLGHRGLRP